LITTVGGSEGLVNLMVDKDVGDGPVPASGQRRAASFAMAVRRAAFKVGLNAGWPLP
jgi:hypothetical protein